MACWFMASTTGLAASERNPARGKTLYEKYCLACHGPQGRGDGATQFDPPVADLTSSDVLFGGLGLMYKRWFPERSLLGRDLLLVSWDEGDLDTPAVRAHMRRLDPIHEGMLTRDGHPIRRFFYRLAYDYHHKEL